MSNPKPIKACRCHGMPIEPNAWTVEIEDNLAVVIISPDEIKEST